MGMSASQARLLTLTARMSDLEYSAQQISNSKLRLATQSEDVAQKYSNALNEQKLSILTGFNNATSVYSDLSYANLCGPDSPLLDQYGLSTNAGAFLVSKSIAEKFKGSTDLNDFLVKMGESKKTFTDGYTATDHAAAQAKVAVSKPAYETAQKATATALKELDSYGENHVTGYDQVAGAWSYSQVEPQEFSYADKDVFSYLAARCTVDESYGSDSSYPSDPNQAKSVLYMALAESQGTAKGHITNLVNDTCGNVTKALTSLLPGISSNAFERAVATAMKSTSDHYVASNEAREPWFQTAGAEGAEKGSNQINELGIGTRWVDVTQMVKTFLANFDSAMGNNGSTVGSSTTTRGTIDGTSVTLVGAGFSYDETKHYDSQTTPDKIKYIVSASEATAGIKEADVKAKYEGLKLAYDTAVGTEENARKTYEADAKELQNSTPTYSNDGANVDYYTNLFNRMCDGYATVEDEDKTMNNSDWIQNQMMNGNLRLEKVNSNSEWEKVSYKSDTNITQETDDRDIAKAEAEYGVATAEIQTKDKRFDLQLKNIETEHTAVQTEVDSVKKVIDKNIDRTFKMFNA